MGATHISVSVTNPASPEKSWEGSFRVAPDCIDCRAPGSKLRAIGLVPIGKRTRELTDGRDIAPDIAVAKLEFMGGVVGATVIFGEDDAEPLLGLTALESAGVEVDPQNQRLKRRPAVRLKRLRPRG